MPSDLDPTLVSALVGAGGALLGAIVGGVLTAAATAWQERQRRGVEAESLTVAIAGEAASVAELVRARHWLEDAWESAQKAKGGTILRLTVRLPPTILPVARGALDRVGLLPGALPALVPKLVLLANGVSADLTRLFDFDDDDHRAVLTGMTGDEAMNFYIELAGVIWRALSTCDEIVAEAKRLYPKRTSALASVPSDLEVDFQVPLE